MYVREKEKGFFEGEWNQEWNWRINEVLAGESGWEGFEEVEAAAAASQNCTNLQGNSTYRDAENKMN